MLNRASSLIPRKAMVLAAGRGKRMRPLSATTPKPLIEVAGRALVDHVLDRLAAVGVEKAVVNVHYLADLVEFHLKKRCDLLITISDERVTLMDTGGAVVKALNHFDDAPFFHLNSDSLWIEGVKPSLEVLASHWNDAAMDGLLLLAPIVSSIGYEGLGDFEMDELGRLSRRMERTVAPFVYAGAAILHPRRFAAYPSRPFSLNDVFDAMIEENRLYGVRMEGIWLHVGTPEAIGAAELAIARSVV